MSVQVGDKFPSVTVKKMGADGLVDVDSGALVAGKKVILFGVPGAYTGTCSKVHLPGYLSQADALKAKGVDEVICLSVNDPFVMKAWGDDHEVEGKVTMLPDGNGELTRALGLEFDGSGAGLGTRSKRFSMVIDDGVVAALEVEESPGEVAVSGAESCLARL